MAKGVCRLRAIECKLRYIDRNEQTDGGAARNGADHHSDRAKPPFYLSCQMSKNSQHRRALLRASSYRRKGFFSVTCPQFAGCQARQLPALERALRGPVNACGTPLGRFRRKISAAAPRIAWRLPIVNRDTGSRAIWPRQERNEKGQPDIVLGGAIQRFKPTNDWLRRAVVGLGR
jgi:hypothetical protein